MFLSINFILEIMAISVFILKKQLRASLKFCHQQYMTYRYLCHSLTRKLLIDTDPGTDDCHALTHLLQLKDVIAITTVFGNAQVSQTTENVCRILDMLGKNHVPVYKGAHCSLQNIDDCSKTSYLPNVHETDGMNDAVCVPKNVCKQAEKDIKAADAIIKTVTENPGQVTLVALGPLTNLAIAIRLCPDLPLLVNSLYIMGSSSKFGNVTKWAEFNFHCDPLSAHITLREFSKMCKVHIVPWEPCLENYITFQQYDALFEGLGETPAKKLIAATGMTDWLTKRKDSGQEGYIFADQLVSMILVYPESILESETYDHVNVNHNQDDDKYGIAEYVKPSMKLENIKAGVFVYKKFDMKYMISVYRNSMKISD